MSRDEALAQLMADWAQGKDFVLSQAPEVVQQLLLWGLLKGATALVVLLFAAYGCTLFIKARRQWEKGTDTKVPSKSDREAATGISWVIVIFAFSLTWGFCIGPMSDALKILIAPKLYIVQYAAGLMP